MTLVMLDGETATRVVERVPPGEARREHRLRDLIHDNPVLMPIHALDPSYGRVFTVAKELSIPGVGFVDVVLADERGRLVIVECKLWRNPQARREVVGQILDYARELSRYAYEDLQRQISVATSRRGNVLFDLACEAGANLSEADFVDRVARDLSAGRFLLLVVGDGITEGTRRIGEYLRDQPGLAFDFGLIEIAEYRITEGDREQTIVQPRVIAQTVLIERHVIRSDVPGVVIEAAARVRASDERAPITDAGRAWREFVERFVEEVCFDDPAQPAPRSGGLGWLRVPLPAGFYVNLYREGGQRVGAQVRFAGAEGEGAFADLLADRDAIDAEFASAGLHSPEWSLKGAPTLSLVVPSPQPWNAEREAEQRIWFARAANQFVNSLRPRLQRLAGE